MLKLIYINLAKESAQNWLESTSSNIAWNNSSNAYYRSLVFTNDGHLLTHGLDFSSAASWGVGLIYNPSNGAATTSAAPTNDNAGYFPVLTNNNGTVSVTWVATSSILSSGYTGSSDITTVGTITTGVWNGSTIDVAHGGTGTTSFTAGQVLVGNGTSPITTLAIDSSVTANSNNLITSGAVAAAILAGFAANDAMVMKGGLGTGQNLIADLPTYDYSAGWTYRVVDAGTYAGKVCEPGDIVIAIADGPSSGSSVMNDDWIVIQTNIDGALTSANLNGTDSYLKRKLFLDSNNLYINQILRAVTINGAAYLADNVTTALNFVNGSGIAITSDGGVKISIDNSVTAQSTSDLYKITHNALGLITGSTVWDPSTITFANVYTTRTGTTLANAVNLFDPDGTAITIAAGDGLNFFLDGTSLKIGHSSTKASSNLTNSGRTYIQSLVLDDYGHVTGISVATETVVNTWRPVYAYTPVINNGVWSGEQVSLIRDSNVGINALSFGSDFLAVNIDTSNSDTTLPSSEIYLAWAEVDDLGNVTYAI